MPESQACAPEGNAALALLAALDGSSVTVCMVALLFVQVTVPPRATVTVAGSNLSASVMLTFTEVGAAGPGVLAAAGVLPVVVDAPEGAQAAANARTATRIPICHRSV